MDKPYFLHRSYKVLILTVIFAVNLFACTSKITQPTPKFIWEPQSNAVSQNVQLALINPEFSENSEFLFYKNNKYLNIFLESLQSDLQQGMLAKGFTVNGSFDGFDEMTFPNKQATELALISNVTLILDGDFTENSKKTMAMGGESIRTRGTLNVGGYVTFSLVEPVSEQKIWIKKVKFPDQSENIVANLLYTDGRLNSLHGNIDNRDAALVNALNNIYPALMQKFWNHLSSDEIKMLKKSAKKARSLKRY
jgi:hypothetical protein